MLLRWLAARPSCAPCVRVSQGSTATQCSPARPPPGTAQTPHPPTSVPPAQALHAAARDRCAAQLRPMRPCQSRVNSDTMLPRPASSRNCANSASSDKSAAGAGASCCCAGSLRGPAAPHASVSVKGQQRHNAPPPGLLPELRKLRILRQVCRRRGRFTLLRWLAARPSCSPCARVSQG